MDLDRNERGHTVSRRCQADGITRASGATGAPRHRPARVPLGERADSMGV
jgi:hypothetical protein